MTEAEPKPAGRRRRSRHIRPRTPPRPIRLTERDFAILLAVGDYRILSFGQIKELFFRSIHKARKRLLRLWQHGLVDRRFRPISLGEGQAEILYVLSRRGWRMLDVAGKMQSPHHRYGLVNKDLSALFLDHTLMRNEFRLRLALAQRQDPQFQLASWRQDKSIRQDVTIIEGSNAPCLVRVALIADALFHISYGRYSLMYFLEADRGTTSLKRLCRKARAYEKLLASKRLNPAKAFEGTYCVFMFDSAMRRMNFLRAFKFMDSQVGSETASWLIAVDADSVKQPERLRASLLARIHMLR